MRRRDKRKTKIVVFIFGAIIISSALWYGRAFSYNDTMTHPALTGNIAKIYNANFEQKLTEQEIGWLKQGSIEEDRAPRWMNHFYNPVSGTGLTGGFSSIVWAQSPFLQIREDGDNKTWQRAINSYVDDNRKSAFIALGHVLHLLEDATVPAHTRLDPHPEGDPYENWVFENKKENIDFSGADTKPIKLSALDDVFDALASYSNNNFLSKDTIGSKDELSSSENFRKVFDDKSYNCIKGNQGQCLVLVKEGISGKEYFLDNPVHSDYFSLLAPKAISYGAGTIKLFFEEVEKRKKEEENKSWWQKLKEKAGGWLGVLTSNNLISGIGNVALDNTENSNGNNSVPSEVPSALADEISEGPETNSSAENIGIGQYSLPANTVQAQEKIIVKLPANTVMAQEKLGGDIVEEITPKNIDIPPAIIEETNPSKLILPKPSPSPLTFIPGVGSAPSPSPSPNADITAPQTTITSTSTASVATTTMSFIFTSSESSSTFGCQLDGAATSSCASPKEYINLSEGTHIFKVAATDAIGNQDATPEEHSWVVDLTAPQLSNIASTAGRISALISWTTSEAGIFQIAYGTSTNYGLTSATTSASNLTLTSLSLNTEYHFKILAQDSLANATTTGDNIFTTTAQAENVIISEIKTQGAGGANDEWIELYNPTSQAVDIFGWSIQYRGSAAGAFNRKNFVTASSIPAHGFFLIANSSGYQGGAVADMLQATFSLSADGGNVFLVNSHTLLESATSTSIIDKISYGTGDNLFPETAVFAPAPSTIQSLERKAFSNSTSSAMVNGIHQWSGNGYDSDNNSQDFVLQSNPNPQNSLMLTEPRSSLPNLMTASAWPTWQKDLARTGRASTVSLATSTMVAKQIATTTLAQSFNSRPVLDSAGNIYIGRADGLAKYSPDGNLLWLYTNNKAYPETIVYSTPLIASDGAIYFRIGSDFSAVDESGHLKWRYPLSGGGVNATPAFLSDGALIMQSNEKVYAINQDATLRWIFDPGRAMSSSNSIGAFVVDSSDNIFVTIDDYIYKISAAGGLVWKKNLGRGYTSLALGAGNTLYVSATLIAGGLNGGFYALNTVDGSIRWADAAGSTDNFNNKAELAPVVDSSSNMVYAIMIYGSGAFATDIKLQAYSAVSPTATSTPSWTSGLIGSRLAAPIIANNKIYLVEQNILRVFDAASGELLNGPNGFVAEDNGDLYTYFGAVGSDGTIYTANSYTLYAIDD